jgi:hypothetical protein
MSHHAPDNTVYIVTQEGVYRHGIWGPYFLEWEARTVAQALAQEDVDGYHSYNVWALPGAGRSIGPTAIGPSAFTVGPPPLYVVRKDNVEDGV